METPVKLVRARKDNASLVQSMWLPERYARKRWINYDHVGSLFGDVMDLGMILCPNVIVLTPMESYLRVKGIPRPNAHLIIHFFVPFSGEMNKVRALRYVPGAWLFAGMAHGLPFEQYLAPDAVWFQHKDDLPPPMPFESRVRARLQQLASQCI